jgi:hypothetical protein
VLACAHQKCSCCKPLRSQLALSPNLIEPQPAPSPLSSDHIAAGRTLQEKTETVEKAVDCLRIITTGNDANKRALVEIPIALPGLMRLLADPKAVCAAVCRWCLLQLAC